MGKNILSKESPTIDRYKEMLINYNKVDGFLAIGFFIVYMFILFLAGQAMLRFNVFLGVPISLLASALVFVMIYFRKQSTKTVGITKSNLARSSLLGLVCSAPLIIFSVIPDFTEVSRPIQTFDVLYSIFFYLVIVSFNEEIVFRGYIQPRLYSLIKADYLAIFTGGVMFAAVHIPFQSAMYYYQHGAHRRISFVQMFLFIGVHIIVNAMYRKYNSLAAPVIFHFFWNFSIIQATLFL